MKHIVQTAIERHVVNGDVSSINTTDKATIACQDANEAREIADGFRTIPNRIAFAGVELYTRGGVKVILSYEEVRDIAKVARDIGPHLMAAE